jgi:hypothetical protein
MAAQDFARNVNGIPQSPLVCTGRPHTFGVFIRMRPLGRRKNKELDIVSSRHRAIEEARAWDILEYRCAGLDWLWAFLRPK